MSKHLVLTWDDFDYAVAVLTEIIRPGIRLLEAEGIYGEPRGGLPLAVALSHRLGLVLRAQPGPGTVWVDDIVDSGRTRERAPGCLHVAWFVRGDRDDTISAQVAHEGEWLVFPWEVAGYAKADEQAYEASRA